MIKTTGIIMLIAFCSLTGESFARKHITEYKKLCQVYDILFYIKSLISCENLTLGEIFDFLKGKDEYSSLVFLKYIDVDTDPRQNMISSLSAHPPFNDEELDHKLLHTFELLGTTDKHTQIEMLDDTLIFFKDKCNKTREDLPRRKRLCRSLGVICGSFAAVILI